MSRGVILNLETEESQNKETRSKACWLVEEFQGLALAAPWVWRTARRAIRRRRRGGMIAFWVLERFRGDIRVVV